MNGVAIGGTNASTGIFSHVTTTFIVPPLIVAFEEVRLMMLPVVPEAVVKPSQVPVAPVKFPLVQNRFVEVALVAKN